MAVNYKGKSFMEQAPGRTGVALLITGTGRRAVTISCFAEHLHQFFEHFSTATIYRGGWEPWSSGYGRRLMS